MCFLPTGPWKSCLLALSAACFLHCTASAQTEPAKKPKAAAAEGKASGRLPAHFRDIVTEKQRNEIYDIQKKYKTKIDVLADEIKSLQSQRDGEIEALLTADQKDRLTKLKSEADKKKSAAADAAKRQAGTVAAEQPATDKAAEPPAPAPVSAAPVATPAGTAPAVKPAAPVVPVAPTLKPAAK